MTNLAIPQQLSKLINSTENIYSDILAESLPYLLSSFPSGEVIWKICESLSKLENSQLKVFLLETGNQDIRTAVKIINNDLDAKNFKYELIQALTLLKRGRDTFLNLINQEYAKWRIFRNLSSIQDNYGRAFIATNFIAFCYKLLNDEIKCDKTFDESKLYFYYHLYHYSEKATDKITGYTRSVEFVIEGLPTIVNVGASPIEEEQAKKAVILYYNLIQTEEENFIKISKSVFGKNLTKKLGNNSFRTETERRGGMKLGGVYGKLYTHWEPPIAHW